MPTPEPNTSPDSSLWGALTVARRIVGWIAIGFGLLTVWMPLPTGLPLLIIGIVMVGPNSPTLRWAGRNLESLLVRLAASRIAWVQRLGQRALDLSQRIKHHLAEWSS